MLSTGHHIISIDLGFAGEPTALTVVEPKTTYRFAGGREDELAWVNRFNVVHLERFPPSAGFPRVAARTKEIASDKRRIPDYLLLVNTSSSGPAALKLLEERRLEPRPLMIINGSVSSRRDHVECVPKSAMIGATQVLLQAERLRIANGLELGSTLHDELLHFRMTPPRVDMDARVAIERALRLNPHCPWWYYWLKGWCACWTDEYEEAIAAIERIGNPIPECRMVTIVGLMALGREDEARAVMAELRQIAPHFNRTSTTLAQPFKDPAHLARLLEPLEAAALPTD